MNRNPSGRKVASHHLKHMMEYAILRGISHQEMLNVVRLSYAYICDETTAVDLGEFYAVLEVIDESLKDDLIGIRSGRYLNLKTLGLIYKISLQATSIEEAFFYLKNYLDATFPMVVTDTVFVDSTVSLNISIESSSERLNRIILENLLTVMAREITMMAGESTEIQMYSPFYTEKYPNSWYQGKQFGLSFGDTILQASLKDKSRLHLDILIPEYLKLIEALKSDDSFMSKVRIAALNLAGPELPQLKMVADSFSITPRTMQRRLREENSTFRDVIDDLKRQISDMLLLHDRFSVADISFALGYSEPAAYIHSFNKWHGISPQKFRETLMASG